MIIAWCAGPIDYITNDDVTVNAILYDKTYSSSKHGYITWYAHYKLEYNGNRITELLSYHESTWKELKLNSTKQLIVNENKFQSKLRSFYSFFSTMVTCLVGAVALIMLFVRWLITDDDGNFPNVW